MCSDFQRFPLHMDVHGGFLNWWHCKSSIPIPSIPWKSPLKMQLFVQAHVQFAPLLDGHLTIDLFKNGQTHLTHNQRTTLVATAARKQNTPGEWCSWCSWCSWHWENRGNHWNPRWMWVIRWDHLPAGATQLPKPSPSNSTCRKPQKHDWSFPFCHGGTPKIPSHHP